MEQLPNELLASVFKYFEIKDLGRIAVACKSWRNLTENPALRFDIKTIALNNVTIDDVSTITRGIRKCEKLQLTECNIGSTKWSNIIKDISSNLRCIKLINCTLSDIHTNKIFQAAGACEHLEKLVIFSDDPKLNLFNEQGLEPLLQCKKLHTLTIDGLEYSKFEVISALMEKVSRYNFTCLDSTLSRKIVYVNDVRVKGFCRNVEGIPKLFPHAEQHNEKYPNGLYVHDIEYAPVKWIFKAETYQIIQREKMYLADRDENIVESLEDLSTDMQNRAKALFKTQDRVYVMLIHIEEYSLRRSGELLHEAQLEYDFKDRPPFWDPEY